MRTEDPSQLKVNNNIHRKTKLSSELCHTIKLSNWYSCIRNHISNGSPKEALLFYTKNRHNPLCMLSIIPLILKACASLSMIRYGKAMHSESIKAGLESDVVVGTSLVNMYGKCNDVISARQVFDELPVKNVVTWNAMIGVYMKNGVTETALCLFEKMSDRTAISWIEMIAGYAKTGDTEMARCLFDRVPLGLKTVVTWTVMVDGYASNGHMTAAKDLFELMPERSFYVWSSMVSGYLKKGDVEEGRAIFYRIKVRNLVNWNSLISGYCQNGLCNEALDAFAKMQSDGFEPDEVSFASALSACAQLGSLETGIRIHNMIIQKRIIVNKFVLNGLVDMYAKCGDLTNARLVFDNALEIEKNDSCWNAIVSGFSIHGQCREALEFFNKMEKSSVSPNEITFLSVLYACAHAGFVEDGLEIFKRMEKYGLSANVKHYGCLVDLLGRAGRLKDAYRIVTTMPMRPNDTIWGALLGACKVHSDINMATRVLERIKLQDAYDSSCYVLMSNIYAASERWEKAESLRTVMCSKRVPKTAGHSSVALNNT